MFKFIGYISVYILIKLYNKNKMMQILTDKFSSKKKIIKFRNFFENRKKLFLKINFQKSF